MMMHPNLSFEQAPPISVPYRFFLTAPWFGVAAGLLLAWQGPAALVSRWAPGALAAAHLLAVGFMLQAMTGALLQFIPVAVGGNVWRPRLVAGIVHPLLALAAIALVTAFAAGQPILFLVAGLLFAVAIGAYVAAAGVALWRTAARGPTLRSLRIAVLALAVTAGLGIVLAIGIGSERNWPLPQLANVHAAWGLGGWALLLLAGVAYYVVPMFQLTPPYPDRFARKLPVMVLGVLALWSFQLDGTSRGWEQAVFLAGLCLAGAFAVITLRLQRRRRRKVADPTFHFFRVAMAALLAAGVSGTVLTLVPSLAALPQAPVWLGVLAFAGVFVSAINGMLYKIVPFINWLHLQRLDGSMLGPNMRDMIPEASMTQQLRLHGLALATLLAAVWLPVLSSLAGLLFAGSCGWLGINLIGGVRRYVAFRDRLLARA